MNGYIISSNKVTFTVNGAKYTISREDAHCDAVMAALYEEDFNGALAAMPLANIEQKIGKHLTYNNGAIYFKGTALSGTLIDLLVEFVETLGKVPVRYVRFVDRLMSNTSFRVREQIYNFITRYDSFTVLEDGRLLMFKAVRPDMFDIYTGKIDNSVGKIVGMPRLLVDDDPARGCSAGLHVGSYEYIMGYGSADSVYIGVAVDPADIVSVPADHDFAKVRTCKYEVLFEVDRSELEQYKPTSEVDWDDEDDWDDDYEDDYEDDWDDEDDEDNYDF